LFIPACKTESNITPAKCQYTNLLHTDLINLTNALPTAVTAALVKEPTPEGALGRNREAYFHVRFQLDIAFLASYAVQFESNEALEKFIKAVEYSYAYQKQAGDFELVIPENLADQGQPTEGDLSSGIAFFTAALGHSLMQLEQATWFQNRTSDLLNERLASLRPKIEKGLLYLLSQKEILKTYDNDAPNRLLFDALAYYSLGTYLKNEEAKSVGIDFIELALTKQDESGYLTEGGGFDSSYNGVSLRLGILLLGIIEPTQNIYAKLQQAIACCASWQASRILATGEISAEGNTRVYPGGENFLGEEKQMAWIDTLLSFYYMFYLTGDPIYMNLAERIINFYE
jgi:hypothetical protein